MISWKESKKPGETSKSEFLFWSHPLPSYRVTQERTAALHPHPRSHSLPITVGRDTSNGAAVMCWPWNHYACGQACPEWAVLCPCACEFHTYRSRSFWTKDYLFVMRHAIPHVGDRGQLEGISSLHPLRGSQGSNSSHQAWQPAPLPGEPSLWPQRYF